MMMHRKRKIKNEGEAKDRIKEVLPSLLKKHPVQNLTKLYHDLSELSGQLVEVESLEYVLLTKIEVILKYYDFDGKPGFLKFKFAKDGHITYYERMNYMKIA